MFKKSVSYLVLSSFLLMDAASCMEPEDKDQSSPPRSPRILRNLPEPSPASSSNSPSDLDPQERLKAISALPWDERNRPYAEFALQEDIPMALRREAVSSIEEVHSLDEITSKRLENLKATFLGDEELSLQERLKFLPNPYEAAPSITTLLSLTHALESANEESYNEWDIYRLIRFLMSSNHMESQQGIETCFFKQPELFLDGDVWEGWLRSILETTDESKRASMLQKLCEVIHSTEDVKKIIDIAKFLLQNSQYSIAQEAATQALWKLFEKQQNLIFSEVTEEEIRLTRDHAIEACEVLLKHLPISPRKESVLQWLFRESEQESDPEAFIILLTQEDPSVASRTRQLIEQRMNEQRIDPATLKYTFKLFIELQRLSEQNLCDKICETLNPTFNDSTNTELLTPIAQIFLRNTDEDLSRKAFKCLTRILTERGNIDNVEDIADDIISVVGTAHPWVQEVIRIMSGIEHIYNPYSALGTHRHLLKKIREPVIHHPSSTRLDDGRVVTFDIETLETHRSRRDILPIKHSEFLALAEDLRQEVQDPENPKAREHFSTISTEYPIEALVNKAENTYFSDLLDSEEGPRADINLRSFKLRRLIADIQALKTLPPSGRGLSLASEATAQFLVNIMSCDTNKDDGVDHTSRLLWNKQIISEEAMQKKRLLATAREHIMEDLRQTREGLLNGEGVVVKHILFGPTGNQNKEVIEPPHKRRYLDGLLGMVIGISLGEETAYFDSLSGMFIEAELRSCTRQEALDILHLYFKPEKVIKRYHEQFNKEGGKGHSTNLICALMGEEMFVMTPEGRMPNDKYSTFDPETFIFKEYTPLLVAEVLLRLNILKELQGPSVTIGAPSPSSSMSPPSSSTLPSEDSIGRL